MLAHLDSRDLGRAGPYARRVQAAAATAESENPRGAVPALVRGRGRPRDPKVDTAILATATAVLREQGYAGLSMRDVADRAGVSRQSVHLRWATKDELVIAVLRHHADQVPIDPLGTIDDAIARLHGVAGRGDLPLLAGIITEMQRNPALAQAYRDEIERPRRARFADLLRHAQQRGELATDVDLALLSEVLPALILRRALVSGEEVGDAYLDRIRRTFFPPPSGGAGPEGKGRGSPAAL